LKEVDNDGSFSYWLKTARSGEWVVYYNGFLMRDRELFMRNGGFTYNFPPRIKAAIQAWQAYLNGGVRLVQKKQGEYEYQYIAIKS
jgi:hypothetical protein